MGPSTTAAGERVATGPVLPEPTGAALVVVTNSQVLIVELDTGTVRSVAVAGRENYHGAWAVGDAVFVLGPEGPFAVPVAPGQDPVVLAEGRAADWVAPSDRSGHAWLARQEGAELVGWEVGADGEETGRQFVLPALLSSAMVAVDGGLVIETLGSLTF